MLAHCVMYGVCAVELHLSLMHLGEITPRLYREGTLRVYTKRKKVIQTDRRSTETQDSVWLPNRSYGSVEEFSFIMRG
jgi:hypothetical protein